MGARNQCTTPAKHYYQLRRYSPVEKIALALITAARKLRPYFQAHKIGVYTNCPLKLILQKPEVSGRLTNWAIELSEFDLEYLLIGPKMLLILAIILIPIASFSCIFVSLMDYMFTFQAFINFRGRERNMGFLGAKQAKSKD